MDETLNEMRDLIRKWVPDEPEFIEQKASSLSQVHLRAVVIEGLKLLSLLVEVDSCKKNRCIHNRSKTVNAILREYKMVAPTLPDLVPDGYLVTGDIVVLLEAFVRVNQSSFEVKYNHDFGKLMMLSQDLSKVGITLVPVVDGRSNYYVDYIPDWVIERLRWLIITIMKQLKDDGEDIEEVEYERLVCSLSTMENQGLGLESLTQMRECGASYKQRLESVLSLGVNGQLSVSDCKTAILKLFTEYQTLKEQGYLAESFKSTDRLELQEALRSHSLIEHGNLGASPHCELCQNHMIEVLTKLKGSKSSSNTKLVSQEVSEYFSLLSVCNKIKGQKILNTRRLTFLSLDVIMFNKFLQIIKKDCTQDVHFLVGGCLRSVNDRLVCPDLIVKAYERKMISSPKWLTKVDQKLVHGLPEPLRQNYELQVQPLLTELDLETWAEYYDSYRENWGNKPSINYNAIATPCNCEENDRLDYVNLSDESFLQYLEALSTLSLGLVNSMKTASTTKLTVNQPDNYYGFVHCNECYYQEFQEAYRSVLLYQKTGEKNRCYSIFKTVGGGDSEEHLASFYCDPKRFFLPIMSSDVIHSMACEMLSWLDFMSDSDKRKVSCNLRKLLLCVMCTPTKRLQTYLQGMRYFIMAYVNELHHVQLLNKLKIVAKSKAEFHTMCLTDDLILSVLTSSDEVNMTKAFKFILNVSYLCHLITKETPDRLTDQIKCFEKFMEPKLNFDSVLINPSMSLHLEPKQEDKFLNDMTRLLSKDVKGAQGSDPGTDPLLMSICSSLFNHGELGLPNKLSRDPQSPSFTSTALDLSSNKSVVVPKLNELGEPITTYDYQTLVSSVVVELSESFKNKLQYKLDRKSLVYKIYDRLMGLVSNKVKHPIDEPFDSEDDILDSVSDEVKDVILKIESDVTSCLSRMESSKCNHGCEKKVGTGKADHNPLDSLWSEEVRMRVNIETSHHEVKDFDFNTFPPETYEELVQIVFESRFKELYFTERVFSPCPLEMLLRNLTRKYYEEQDFFECFKYILVSTGYDNRVGRYDHKKINRLGFKEPALNISEVVRISTRESNSESILKRLDKSFFTNSSLRNLCFYSDESATERSCVGTNIGRLKFGLSYKEQVGGNRELYVGDLNTKLTTRLIEDYFESIVGDMRYSCLNNEKEFEKALLDMKAIIRQSGFVVSMDHSKWGPHMSPVIFSQFLRLLKLSLLDGSVIDNRPILELLNWHIHKMVEVPFNVVRAYMKGYIKRCTGVMEKNSMTMVEDFMHKQFETGVVPSHISSVIDMGQGILHNVSDFYGLVTEQFINYCIKLCYDTPCLSYTSSDDEILMSSSFILKKNDGELDVELAKDILDFHDFLSRGLNKFVSPKTVAGTFACEFKSRFFIWSQEVPLLTKFVAAALHNVKAKAPNQLAETIDTILDQCVANGVSIEVVGRIAKRTNALLRYSGHPYNLFLCLEETDVKDWVDGSRGYRLQRSVENVFPDDEVPGIVRAAARKVFHLIRSGTIEEEYLVSTIQTDPDDCLRRILEIADVTNEQIERILDFRWLNLRAHGDYRMVLRTKLMNSARIIEREEIPSLIKSVQSKLSKNFVRGAKKIITDAVNKSAFQSCIASGFVGVCKSMGSKCVRDGKGSFLYIKDVLKDIIKHVNCHSCRNYCNIYCREALKEVSEYSRPLFWDYFALVLTNACELGNWVFSKAVLPKSVYKLDNPSQFWLCKPSSHTELEDKVNLNHVLFSIKRNFPSLFEEHVAPYLSDLNTLKISWVQRIKFLDICVAVDMTSESLGIISHMIKRKREELYVVKQNEQSMSHLREASTFEEGLQLNSYEICYNFLLQILFESMLTPVLLTTSQLKKYFWYGEVELLPNTEPHELQQLTQFVMDCKMLNISKAMTIDDLDLGFVQSTMKMTDVNLNLSTFLTKVDWANRYLYETFESMFIESPDSEFSMELVLVFSHIRKSYKHKYEHTTTYTVKASFVLETSLFSDQDDQDVLVIPVKDVECFVSNSPGNHLQLDGAGLIPLVPVVSGKEVLNFDLLLKDQDVSFSGTSPHLSKVRLDFSAHIKELKNKFSYKIIGPEMGFTPLHLDKGIIKEGDRIVSKLNVNVTSKSLFMALGLLSNDKVSEFLESLFYYLKSSGKTGALLSMTTSDLQNLVDNYNEDFKQILKRESDWVSFGAFKLAYSNSLSAIMIQDERGPYRLKGLSCEKLLKSHDERVEID
ncbi:L protein [Mammarenavirus flexalense]|uniref:RNA-directed RNA polymerase L n=1 Tax=Flexal mammarenavirus (isolate Rat/Brazil/BeAn 293022/1975) TaxID=3052305 RepID=B2MW47_FLEVB|nr:L protein [Mammarenavirus flexalense]ACC94298.1 L protein [Mammarenavirus flexalense]